MARQAFQSSNTFASKSGARGAAAMGMVAVMVVAGAAGCGMEKERDNQVVDVDTIPVMPMPMKGQALLAGHVVDGEGRPVAGVTLTVAETDGKAVSDDAGAYQLTVPADSTLTLVTTGAGLATTYRESVVLAAQAMVSGFDVLVLPSMDVNAMNAMGAPDLSTTRGLMAVHLHSLDPGCGLAGARVTVSLLKAATVVYSRRNPAGTGIDVPDTSLDSVQLDTNIQVWLAGVISPGALLRIDVQQPGCRMMNQSLSMNGMIFPGLRRADAQALTEADLFLGRP